jgi:predicted nucleotide-binding protein
VVHLPVADEQGRPDAFEMNPPAADQILFSPQVDRDWHAHREPRERDDSAVAIASAPNPLEVVVVHGRGTARTAFFFELLRRLGLRPLAYDELAVRPGAGNPSTREVVRTAFARAQAVIVLFTGDDLTGLRPDVPGPPQPHVHVVFEAGVAVALAHTRTIIIEMPPISGLLDLEDVHTVRFSTGTPEERHQLVRRLRAAGCEPDTEGSSTWLNLEFPPSPPSS